MTGFVKGPSSFPDGKEADILQMLSLMLREIYDDPDPIHHIMHSTLAGICAILSHLLPDGLIMIYRPVGQQMSHCPWHVDHVRAGCICPKGGG